MFMSSSNNKPPLISVTPMKNLLSLLLLSSTLITPVVQALDCDWRLKILNEQTREIQYFDVTLDAPTVHLELETHGHTGMCAALAETADSGDSEFSEIVPTYESATLICGLAPKGSMFSPTMTRGFKYDLPDGLWKKRLAKLTFNQAVSLDGKTATGRASEPLYTATLKCIVD